MFWPGSADAIGTGQAVDQPATQVSIEVVSWKAVSYADLVLDDPELASCFQLSPGWWSAVTAPVELPTSGALTPAVAKQAAGAGGPVLPASLRVVVASAEVGAPAAIAYERTVLVLTPKAPGFLNAIAPVATQALLAAAARPAAPDSRASELLLAFGEALARAGSYSLATLPPTLRPVHDWLDRKDAGSVLATLAATLLDSETPLQSRYARLARIAQPDGASPDLAHAASFLLEAFGDPARARREPVELLMAWRNAKGDAFPPLPPALRRALAEPLRAGLPDEPTQAETDLLGTAVMRRLLAAETLPPPPPAGTDVPTDLRHAAAAILRGRGTPGACDWLPQPLPRGLRTNCRTEGESGGFLFARPLPAGGSEIVARAVTGEEAAFLRWPRLVLYPLVLTARGEMLFVDPQGIWSLALGADGPARLIAAGSFRHLVASRDGTYVAAARWPEGKVVLLGARGGTRELAIEGRGGVTWADEEVVLASDGNRMNMASIDGEVAPWPASQPCTRSLATLSGTILAAVGPPCEPALLRLSQADGTATRLFKLGRELIGLALLPDGSLVFGDAEGLWRWSGAETADRLGSGLTPGPG